MSAGNFNQFIRNRHNSFIKNILEGVVVLLGLRNELAAPWLLHCGAYIT